MKRILFFIVMTLCTMTTFAQETKEQIQKSEERAKNLQTLLDKYSDTKCGDETIDGFGQSVRDAAVFAIANREKLEGLYYRQMGQTKDGVTDATIVKPKLEDWLELLATVTAETKSIENAVDNAKAAGEQMKQIAENAKNNKNPMKMAKLAKMAKGAGVVMEFGNSATPILLEESAGQLKAVQDIIETIKSGKNL
ncbi:MAG: hypothetical protein HXN39_01775 [Prevotella histicola]|nr:hypothetical protein [Prevotella histicola]